MNIRLQVFLLVDILLLDYWPDRVSCSPVTIPDAAAHRALRFRRAPVETGQGDGRVSSRFGSFELSSLDVEQGKPQMSTLTAAAVQGRSGDRSSFVSSPQPIRCSQPPCPQAESPEDQELIQSIIRLLRQQGAVSGASASRTKTQDRYYRTGQYSGSSSQSTTFSGRVNGQRVSVSTSTSAAYEKSGKLAQAASNASAVCVNGKCSALTAGFAGDPSSPGFYSYSGAYGNQGAQTFSGGGYVPYHEPTNSPSIVNGPMGGNVGGGMHPGSIIPSGGVNFGNTNVNGGGSSMYPDPMSPSGGVNFGNGNVNSGGGSSMYPGHISPSGAVNFGNGNVDGGGGSSMYPGSIIPSGGVNFGNTNTKPTKDPDLELPSPPTDNQTTPSCQTICNSVCTSISSATSPTDRVKLGKKPSCCCTTTTEAPPIDPRHNNIPGLYPPLRPNRPSRPCARRRPISVTNNGYYTGIVTEITIPCYYPRPHRKIAVSGKTKFDSRRRVRPGLVSISGKLGPMGSPGRSLAVGSRLGDPLESQAPKIMVPLPTSFPR